MNVFFLITGLLIILLCQKANVHIDAFSLAYILLNFSVVGTIATLYVPTPLLMKQFYMVWIGIIVAYIFTWIPEWTGWVLLILMALYDIAAVLIPGGPLRALVDMAIERQQAIPALIYESRPAQGGYRGAGNWGNRGGEASATSGQPGAEDAAAGDVTAAERSNSAGSAAAVSGHAVAREAAALELSVAVANVGAPMLQDTAVLSARGSGRVSETGLSARRPRAIGESSGYLRMDAPGEGIGRNRLELPPPPSPPSAPPPAPPPLPAAQASPLTSADVNGSASAAEFGSTPASGLQLFLANPSLAHVMQSSGMSGKSQASPSEVMMGLANNAVAPEAPSSRFHVPDQGNPAEQHDALTPEQRQQQQQQQRDDESDEFDMQDGIKLGLGDFIFYSMLVGFAAKKEMMTVYSSFIGIIAGLGFTLLCLSLYKKALPALPFSIAIGVIFYFLTRIVLAPYLTPLAFLGCFY